MQITFISKRELNKLKRSVRGHQAKIAELAESHQPHVSRVLNGESVGEDADRRIVDVAKKYAIYLESQRIEGAQMYNKLFKQAV